MSDSGDEGIDGDALARFPRAMREEAQRQATMLIQSGVSVEDARQELLDNRIPEPLAVATLVSVLDSRKRVWRSTSIGLVMAGVLLLAAGGGLTASSYAFTAEGGSYVMTTGLLAAGAASFLVGIGMSMRPRRG